MHAQTRERYLQTHHDVCGQEPAGEPAGLNLSGAFPGHQECVWPRAAAVMMLLPESEMPPDEEGAAPAPVAGPATTMSGCSSSSVRLSLLATWPIERRFVGAGRPRARMLSNEEVRAEVVERL